MRRRRGHSGDGLRQDATQAAVLLTTQNIFHWAGGAKGAEYQHVSDLTSDCAAYILAAAGIVLETVYASQ